MDFLDNASEVDATNSHYRTLFQTHSAALLSEVERLLSGRTRDIRLKGELHRLFLERTWPRTAKIVRAWMIWVSILDVLTLGLNLMLLPKAVFWSMIPPACILPPSALATAFLWRRRHTFWIQHLSLFSGTILILMSVSLVGIAAGGEFYERHMIIMLFVAVTAIIIFNIPLAWTSAIAFFSLALFLMLQLQNPVIATGSTLAATAFFACGIVATVVARRTMTVLDQKAFLLEMRDWSRVNELASANAQLEQLAKTDPLTGVANRRAMMDSIDLLWSRDFKQTGGAMLMCDIDEFKKLNDHLGHAEGDRCLVAVAGIIQISVRTTLDHVVRYGGEEFLVVLPGMKEKDAIAVADRIRRCVEAASLPNPTSCVSPRVTLSIGVAVRPPGEQEDSPEDLQSKADAALYFAKRNGRNRVALFNEVN